MKYFLAFMVAAVAVWMALQFFSAEPTRIKISRNLAPLPAASSTPDTAQLERPQSDWERQSLALTESGTAPEQTPSANATHDPGEPDLVPILVRASDRISMSPVSGLDVRVKFTRDSGALYKNTSTLDESGTAQLLVPTTALANGTTSQFSIISPSGLQNEHVEYRALSPEVALLVDPKLLLTVEFHNRGTFQLAGLDARFDFIDDAEANRFAGACEVDETNRCQILAQPPPWSTKARVTLSTGHVTAYTHVLDVADLVQPGGTTAHCDINAVKIVTQNSRGETLPNVSIALGSVGRRGAWATSLETSDNGEVEIPLQAGAYKAVVADHRYAYTETDISHELPNVIMLTEMSEGHIGSELHGQVVDVNDRPVGAAIVNAERHTPNSGVGSRAIHVKVRSAEDGSFTLPLQHPGDYAISAYHEDFGLSSMSVVQSELAGEITIVLEKLQSVAFGPRGPLFDIGGFDGHLEGVLVDEAYGTTYETSYPNPKYVTPRAPRGRYRMLLYSGAMNCAGAFSFDTTRASTEEPIPVSLEVIPSVVVELSEELVGENAIVSATSLPDGVFAGAPERWCRGTKIADTSFSVPVLGDSFTPRSFRLRAKCADGAVVDLIYTDGAISLAD